MKTLKLLVPFLMLAIVAKAQLPADELYSRFVLPQNTGKAPANYGLTPETAITLGAYEDMTNQDKVNAQFNRFINTFLWPDGSQVKYIDRKTVMINSVNYDKFRTVKPGTTDTITLFVDMYKSGPVNIPDFFKPFTKEMLASQFAPILTQMKSFFAIGDKYADTTAKRVSIQLLSYLQTTIGIDFLMDNDYVNPIVDNYGIDTDLKAYLMRSYIFHKFENEITGQADPKIKAYNGMVDDYQDVIKKHPELVKGNLDTLMVKKS